MRQPRKWRGRHEGVRAAAIRTSYEDQGRSRLVAEAERPVELAPVGDAYGEPRPGELENKRESLVGPTAVGRPMPEPTVEEDALAVGHLGLPELRVGRQVAGELRSVSGVCSVAA